MLLTPEQLQEIKQIIEDHHDAFMVDAISPDAVPAEVLADLKSKGLVDPKVESMKDAYLYGQLVGILNNAKVANMPYDQFKEHVRRNPIPLTEAENQAVKMAVAKAGQYAKGLGNTVSIQTGSTIIEGDAVLRAETLDGIRDATAMNIVRRQTVKQLKSDLGWMAKDWSRDWNRIAVTEKHDAMQRGLADNYRKLHGGDSLVAKRSMPDACFRAGTLITTKQGDVPIEDVCVGDYVLTHKMRWRKVTHRFKKDYFGDVFGFNGGIPNGTGNHPFLVDLDWRRADSIQCGDYLIGLGTSIPKDNPAKGLKGRLFTDISGSDASSSMPITPVQLYSYLQFRDSDINVKFVDGQFRDGREILKQLTEGKRFRCGTAKGFCSSNCFSALRFVGTCFFSSLVRIGYKVKSFFWRHSFESNPLTLRLCGEGYTPFMESAFDCSTRNLEMSGQGSYGMFTCFPQFNKFGFFNEFHGNSLTAEARKVNSIAKSYYSGKVYNLEVEEDESYMADGFAVHNCEHCKRIFIGPDGQPRIFKLSTLESNATNVGRKAADWKAVLGGVHPNCFMPGTKITTISGQRAIQDIKPGDVILTDSGEWQTVSHVWESKFDGNLFSVDAGVRKISGVTGNHQLLSDTGWVAVEDLKVGDNLIGLRPSISLMDLDAREYPPVLSEDSFFASVIHGFSRSGVPITAVYLDSEFYVREGEIDIDSFDRKIGNGGKSSGNEPIVDSAFVGRFKFTKFGLSSEETGFQRMGRPSQSLISSLCEDFPLFTSHFSQTIDLGLTCSSRGLASRFDSCCDCASTSMEFLGDSLYRHQLVKVHIDNLGNIEFNPTLVGSTSSVHLEAPFITHKIVNVKCRPYSGVVYNLTVDNVHSYLTDGIIAHNCQCQLIRIPAGWGFDEEGELVPGGELGARYEDKEDLALAMIQENDLQKAFQIQDRIDYQGIPIDIENRVGSVRKWRDAQGGSGATKMMVAYGYIRNTTGADEDELDVFVGTDPRAPMVYVIEQQNPENGIYDESKCMLGFSNQQAAEQCYRDHYDNMDFALYTSPMAISEFKQWSSVTRALEGEMLKSEEPSGLRYVVRLGKQKLEKAEVDKIVGAATSQAGNRNPSPGTATNLIHLFPKKKKPPRKPLHETGYFPDKDSLNEDEEDEEVRAIVRAGIAKTKEIYTIEEPFRKEPQTVEKPDHWKEDKGAREGAEDRKKQIKDWDARNIAPTNTIPKGPVKRTPVKSPVKREN